MDRFIGLLLIIVMLMVMINVAHPADTWKNKEEVIGYDILETPVLDALLAASDPVVVPAPSELKELQACPEGVGMCLHVAWDANTESDLAGYIVYRGRVSRLSSKLDKIIQWCAANEPTNEECVNEWIGVCADPNDKECHSMLYEYSEKFIVADLPAQRSSDCPDPYDPFKLECCEFTLINHEEGTYYYAATAHDTEDNESSYSDELVHTFIIHKPVVTAPTDMNLYLGDE